MLTCVLAYLFPHLQTNRKVWEGEIAIYLTSQNSIYSLLKDQHLYPRIKILPNLDTSLLTVEQIVKSQRALDS